MSFSNSWLFLVKVWHINSVVIIFNREVTRTLYIKFPPQFELEFEVLSFLQECLKILTFHLKWSIFKMVMVKNKSHLKILPKAEVNRRYFFTEETQSSSENSEIIILFINYTTDFKQTKDVPHYYLETKLI